MTQLKLYTIRKTEVIRYIKYIRLEIIADSQGLILCDFLDEITGNGMIAFKDKGTGNIIKYFLSDNPNPQQGIEVSLKIVVINFPKSRTEIDGNVKLNSWIRVYKTQEFLNGA